MDSFKKVCFIGYTLVNEKKRKVFVEIEFKTDDDKHRLSITGVVGPKKNGNCWGSCGQINGELGYIVETNHVDGWDCSKVTKLAEIWDLYHLNDMHPGTEKQEAAIESRFEKYPDYKTCCEYLREIGLYEDNGYKYGYSWLFRPVPEHILKWLYNLPDNTSIYPWC